MGCTVEGFYRQKEGRLMLKEWIMSGKDTSLRDSRGVFSVLTHWEPRSGLQMLSTSDGHAPEQDCVSQGGCLELTEPNESPNRNR